MAAVQNLYAQRTNAQSAVRGIVISAVTDRPVAGVRVSARCSGQLGITDLKGQFRLLVDQPGDTLVFNHIGHEPTSMPTTSAMVNDAIEVVLMEKVNTIEEVAINTGYQSLRANEVTGAVQVLGNKALNQQVGINILERINNIATAVRFDNQAINNTDLQKTNVSVRGLSTINGYLDPLIVLDGFIYEGNISNIDPNTIDNISILKDAAAASIWGARAGNGVIVITSKKGKAGEKPSVSFNSTVSLRQIPDLYALYQPENADYIAVEEMLFKSGYYDRQITRTPHLALTPATEILYQRRQNLISSADSLAAMHQLIAQDGRAAYADEFFRRPLVQQYAANITGNSSLNAYNFGFGYTSDRNENAAGMNKINVLMGNSFRPFANFRLDLNVMFTNQKGYSGMPSYSSFSYAGKQVPYLRFRDENQNGLPFYTAYREAFLDSYMTGKLLDWSYYPLEDYKQSTTGTNLTDFYPTVNLSYKILPFLDINVGGQYQYQKNVSLKTDEAESYAARFLVNQFTSVNPTTGAVVHQVPVGGVRSNTGSEVSSYTLRSQVNLDKKWNSHHLIGIFGSEIRENANKGESFTVYGYSALPLQTVPVDYTTVHPTIPGNGAARITGDPRYSQTQNRFVSMYSNLSYLYQKRYGVSLSLRRDGANIFGAQTNDQWNPFWSMGMLWNISEEKFIPKEIFSMLKFRSTYGRSGNVDLRKTPLPIANVTSGMYTNFPALVVGTLNDPTLRWEKVATTNFGLDFALANNRISGNVDYYIKNGTDLYGMDLYDYTVWGVQQTITKNTASMLGTGFDIMLNSNNLLGEFSWQTAVLFSQNRNKTTAYYNATSSGSTSFLTDGNIITPIVGKPLNALAAYRWAGLNDLGNPMGYLDGEPSVDYNGIRRQAAEEGASDEGIIYYGSAKPQIFGSIINTFQYNQVTLSVNFSFKGDYYFRKPTTSYTNLFSRGIAYPDFEDRWLKPGDEGHTAVPSLVYPSASNRDNFYANSEINVLRGDHIRLEYINLSYSPMLNFMRNTRSIQLYANMSNLGIIWRKNGNKIDPEFPYRMGPQRVIAFGIKANL
ncbi:SusC/RagA family TonB-linked outer membrane protein [Sphingobacterium alkalisoli]|nr:SusC/RagA family TonB-linked outer membrane protein [Sphingobacterium alkalisoli]